MANRNAIATGILAVIFLAALAGAYLVLNKNGPLPVLPFGIYGSANEFGTLKAGADWPYPECPTTYWQIDGPNQYTGTETLSALTSCPCTVAYCGLEDYNAGKTFNIYIAKTPLVANYKNVALVFYAQNRNCTTSSYSCVNPMVIKTCAESELAKVTYDAVTKVYSADCVTNPDHIQTTTTVLSANVPNPTLTPVDTWIREHWEAFMSWIKGFLGLSITRSSTSYAPSAKASFSVSIPLSARDFDFSDGAGQRKYGLWYILDASQTTFASGDWEEIIADTWSKEVQFTAPSATGTYYFVVNVIRYDYSYLTNGTWQITGPTLDAKDVTPFSVAYPDVSNPTLPAKASWISTWASAIWTWILALFGVK